MARYARSRWPGARAIARRSLCCGQGSRFVIVLLKTGQNRALKCVIEVRGRERRRLEPEGVRGHGFYRNGRRSLSMSGAPIWAA
jgi:hypothetical protein